MFYYCNFQPCLSHWGQERATPNLFFALQFLSVPGSEPFRGAAVAATPPRPFRRGTTPAPGVVAGALAGHIFSPAGVTSPWVFGSSQLQIDIAQ